MKYEINKAEIYILRQHKHGATTKENTILSNQSYQTKLKQERNKNINVYSTITVEHSQTKPWSDFRVWLVRREILVVENITIVMHVNVHSGVLKLKHVVVNKIIPWSSPGEEIEVVRVGACIALPIQTINVEAILWDLAVKALRLNAISLKSLKSHKGNVKGFLVVVLVHGCLCAG